MAGHVAGGRRKVGKHGSNGEARGRATDAQRRFAVLHWVCGQFKGWLLYRREQDGMGGIPDLTSLHSEPECYPSPQEGAFSF